MRICYVLGLIAVLCGGCGVIGKSSEDAFEAEQPYLDLLKTQLENIEHVLANPTDEAGEDCQVRLRSPQGEPLAELIPYDYLHAICNPEVSIPKPLFLREFGFNYQVSFWLATSRDNSARYDPEIGNHFMNWDPGLLDEAFQKTKKLKYLIVSKETELRFDQGINVMDHYLVELASGNVLCNWETLIVGDEETVKSPYDRLEVHSNQFFQMLPEMQ